MLLRRRGETARAEVDSHRRRGGRGRGRPTTVYACAVACGEPLDEVVLRSYCIGAAHMALGWVTSEGIAVDETGEPQDLTIRSFGDPAGDDMPPVDVEIEPGDGAAGQRLRRGVRRGGRRGVDREGCPPDWPTHRRVGAS